MGRADAELERLVVDGIDAALGRPHRERLPAGSLLLEEGRAVEAIVIVLDGEVGLRRSAAHGDVGLAGSATGRIFGLTPLTLDRRAFFTCAAVTDLVVIRLSEAELDAALRADPALQVHFLNLLLRSLARRHRRTTELQVEVAQLNHWLGEQRDELAAALHDLEQAHLQLLASARMALMGELAAGLLHELSNPAGALARLTAHLAGDLEAAFADPDDELPARSFRQGRASAPPDTRSARRVRPALEEAVGDRRLADQLLAAGIDDPAHARRLLAALAAAPDPDRRLAELTRCHRLGRQLQMAEELIGRIGGVVTTLRRELQQGSPVAGDVGAQVEDALGLLAHRLRRMTVERTLHPCPPVVEPAEALAQVWLAVLASTVDAAGGRGRLDVEVGPVDEATVQVRVRCSDPRAGAVLARRLEPAAAGHDASAAHGAGIGLALSRHVVERGGGQLELLNDDAGTALVVRLPTAAAHPTPRTGTPRQGPGCASS